MFSQEIYQYIKDNISQRSIPDIKQELIKKGWQEAAINETLEAMARESQPAAPESKPEILTEKKPGPGRVRLKVGLICLILAGVVSFFYLRGCFCPGNASDRLAGYLYTICAIFASFLLLSWLILRVDWWVNRLLKICGLIFFILLLFNLWVIFFYIYSLLGDHTLSGDWLIIPAFTQLLVTAVAIPCSIIYLAALIKKLPSGFQVLDGTDKFFALLILFFWLLFAAQFLVGINAGL